MTLTATEAPAVAEGPRFTATQLGLAGPLTIELDRIVDGTLVEARVRIVSSDRDGRTRWMDLEAPDGAVGIAALDDAFADRIAAGDYAVGHHVVLRGVARTSVVFAHSYIAVRTVDVV